MKCLSVQQPWSWAIIHGPKRIENRGWLTSYRGPMLIHAGKSKVRIGDYGPGEPPESSLDFGAILGVVELYDCVQLRSVKGQPFAEGPWCWLLRDVRAFDQPVEYRGAQGLFEVPESVVRDLPDFSGRSGQSLNPVIS